MSESLSWGLVALSALFLCLVYGLLRRYLQLKQREMLHKERLGAIAKAQPVPGEVFKETGWRSSVSLRLATAPGMKIAGFVGFVLLFSGAGLWAGLSFLPEYYVLHDFWSLGLIGVALGLGLLAYAFFFEKLTKPKPPPPPN